MVLKDTVSLQKLQAVMIPAMFICQTFFERIRKEFVITSVADGKHRPDSKHYQGQAFDIRTKHLSEVQLKECFAYLKLQLYFQYDVILEKDHIHIEWDETF